MFALFCGLRSADVCAPHSNEWVFSCRNFGNYGSTINIFIYFYCYCYSFVLLFNFKVRQCALYTLNNLV